MKLRLRFAPVRDPAEPAWQCGHMIPYDEALALFTYVKEQGTAEDRKGARGADPPWPPKDNPALNHLITLAIEEAQAAPAAGNPRPLEMAITDLAEKAWYEGGLAERARMRALSHPSEAPD